MLELRQALENSPHDYESAVMDFAGDISLESMVDHVERRIGDDPMSLIGFSMGGWVAQAVAARTANCVDSLVLVSSWTHAPESYLEIVRELHEQIAGGAPLADLRSAVMRGIADPDRAEALADRWLAMAERIGVETFLAETSAILAHPHVDEEAQQIDTPTLLVCGARDGLITPESQAEDARSISGSTFVIIENSGHNLVWEQPTGTNNAVLGWLGEQLT